MINLNDKGFSVENSPEENSAIMQEAVSCGGDIYVGVVGDIHLYYLYYFPSEEID